MTDLQVLAKIIQDKDFSIITNNGFDASYFSAYKDEFSFIQEHIKKYNKVPDRLTFLNRFRDLDLPEVTESTDFLIDALREEKNFLDVVPLLNKAADFAKGGNSRKGVQYLLERLPALIQYDNLKGSDLVHETESRLQLVKDKKNPKAQIFIKTGFEELDEVILGLKRSEELLTIAARTNEGKSWIATKILLGAWQQGETVGLYSGEMDKISLGYRFDTLFKCMSNYALYKGIIKDTDYADYLTELRKSKNSFRIITPKDLGGKATVSKINAFIQSNNITVCGIDQYSLMEDEKSFGRYKDRREMFGNITEGLFNLSQKLSVPVVGVSQINRDSLKDDNELPDLIHLSESDLIGQNSTRVIMLRQIEGHLHLVIRKNREGLRNKKFVYAWDIDKGVFINVPTEDTDVGTKRVAKERRKFKEDTTPWG